MLDDRTRDRRKLAAECLITAQEITDPNLRAVLLGMAQRWLDLANGDYDPTARDDLDVAVYRQVILAQLGQELQAQFALPHELPQQLIALLMQLDGKGQRRPH
jgi:hypothetical protein